MVFNKCISFGTVIIYTAIACTGAIFVLAALLLIRDHYAGKKQKEKSVSGKGLPGAINCAAPTAGECFAGAAALQIGRKRLYETLVEKIHSANGSAAGILMAGTSVEALPVTVPVNAALKLAEGSKKCLVIDLDVKRDALSKAFEVENRGELARPCRTGIENLLVWPAHNFGKMRKTDVPFLVRKAREQFDYVIINAPEFPYIQERRAIAAATDISFIFSDSAQTPVNMKNLLKASNSRLMGTFMGNSEQVIGYRL